MYYEMNEKINIAHDTITTTIPHTHTHTHVRDVSDV